jgi:hypothetical protein
LLSQNYRSEAEPETSIHVQMTYKDVLSGEVRKVVAEAGQTVWVWFEGESCGGALHCPIRELRNKIVPNNCPNLRQDFGLSYPVLISHWLWTTQGGHLLHAFLALCPCGRRGPSCMRYILWNHVAGVAKHSEAGDWGTEEDWAVLGGGLSSSRWGTVSDWMLVSLLTLCTETLSLSDVIRMQGLWEVIRIRWGHECGTLMNGINVLVKVSRELASSLCHLRTQQKDCPLWTKRPFLSRQWISWHLDLGLPSLYNHEK